MLKRTLEDYKVLLRNIPSTTVTLFVVSVIVMNLLANKGWCRFHGWRSIAASP